MQKNASISLHKLPGTFFGVLQLAVSSPKHIRAVYLQVRTLAVKVTETGLEFASNFIVIVFTHICSHVAQTMASKVSTQRFVGESEFLIPTYSYCENI